MDNSHLQDNSAAITRVLWRVLVLNIGVAVAKVAVGTLTGTIAIVADGIHSAVDGASNVVALIAGSIASQPPDDDHPYGHERFETIGTLAIGGLLLLTAWEVLQIAIERLIDGTTPDIGPAQFAVLTFSLLVNIGVATYERQQARQLQSELLSADADHTASDIWVTVSVFISLIAVEAGLPWMDAVAALLIVLLIGYIAYRILDRTISVLVDRAPVTATDIEQAIHDTPGIQRIVRARSRGGHDAVQIDVDVALAPVVNATSAQDITDSVRERLMTTFPGTNEVRVQILSESLEDATEFEKVRSIADPLGLGVHEVLCVATADGNVLEMHVEVQPGITLQEAHDQINTLENRLKNIDNIVGVVTHIEPATTGTTLPAGSPAARKLLADVMQQLRTHFPQGHWHAEKLHLQGSSYVMSVHCHLPGNLGIETAHQFAEDAELYLRSQFASLQRVTIHTEPAN